MDAEGLISADQIRREIPTLHPPEAFARYTAAYGAPARTPDAEATARAIARKHCAGRRGTVEGEEILEALAKPPDRECPMSQAVSWMLGTIRVHECALLVTRCGVRHEDLARHVRERPQQRAAIVRFLNQFSIPARSKR